MEANVVAPAPAPAPAHQAKNVTSEQGGGDSTFAPTLSRALSEKKASEKHQSQTDRQQTAPTEPPPEDTRSGGGDENDMAEGQTAVAAAPSTIENHSKKTDAGKTNAAADGSASQAYLSAAHKAKIALAGSRASLFPLPLPTPNENGLADGAKTDGSLLLLKNAAAEKTMFSLESLRAGSAKDTSLKERIISSSAPTVLSGSLQKLGAQASEPGMQGRLSSLEMMQHNDSVGWSRLRSEMPQANLQQSWSGAFTEDTILQATSQRPVSTENLLAGLSTIATDGKGRVSLRNGEQISLRQAFSGQFLETKIDTADPGGEQKNSQQFLGGDNSPARQILATTAARPAENSIETSFSQSLNQAGGDKTTQTAAEPLRPGIMPFTTVVSENEILQQVTNKFRISQHLQDSKITMRLHPAELGNLKIDIQIKGGTLHANIVAQSQQVHEILEKNMPRLRTLMEQQGLEVGEIVIKVDSDVPSEHNLFDEQLSERSFFAEQDGKQSRNVFTLETESEEEELAEQTPDPGVNVKI